MCGICGYFDPKGESSAITEMNAALAHRGPDGAGVWSGDGIHLGHRRLAIVDLTDAGAQPMTSNDGRYVLTYNGEIYNHMQLREALAREGVETRWRGHSDTETLLRCIELWGVERALKAAVGMFAFAVWDRERTVLILARDRVGEKPLYYGWQESMFFFASDLVALRAHPAFVGRIDRRALGSLLRRSYVPAPASIYEGIRKVPAGGYIEIDVDRRAETFHQYWALRDAVAAGQRQPFVGEPEDAIEETERVLAASIQGQLLSDVPIGAFLSGGIDSTVVVAIMQQLSSDPVRTFTIGFENPNFDESVHARAVAGHLGTQHTEFIVTSREAIELVPSLGSMYSEPFADSSQIPTYFVSRLARRDVTVALSGDGGDEVFGGYNRHVLAGTVWPRVAAIPRPVRRITGSFLRAVSPRAWDAMGKLPGMHRSLRSSTGDRLHKIADAMVARDGADFYDRLTSQRRFRSSLVLGESSTGGGASLPDDVSLSEAMMILDTENYLADDILVKVDRAAMANSLETRVPMLDHRVVEFAWALPLDLKIRKGESKWVLRQIIAKYVPVELVDRPKVGFGVPLHDWLRGPLREWADSLLDPHQIAEAGYLHGRPIMTMWKEHLSGRRNLQHQLWPILMFQSWLEAQRTASATCDS